MRVELEVAGVWPEVRGKPRSIFGKTPIYILVKPLGVFPYRASVGILVSVSAMLCSLATLSRCYIIFFHLC